MAFDYTAIERAEQVHDRRTALVVVHLLSFALQEIGYLASENRLSTGIAEVHGPSLAVSLLSWMEVIGAGVSVIVMNCLIILCLMPRTCLGVFHSLSLFFEWVKVRVAFGLVLFVLWPLCLYAPFTLLWTILTGMVHGLLIYATIVSVSLIIRYSVTELKEHDALSRS